MDPAPKNTWDRVLDRLRAVIPAHSYRTWFEPTRFVEEDDHSISISVPNGWFAEWLRSHYSERIDACLRDEDRAGATVRFLPEEDEQADDAPTPDGAGGGAEPAAAAMPIEPYRPADRVRRATPPRRPVPPAPSHDAGDVRGRSTNPRYTFDTFVVSSCNQFAHAAAMAVSDQPTRSYNPLYVYGGVGLGKTHLMQAIGNAARPGQRMAYVSSEHFMNELINAIRFEKTLEFKDRYRTVDLLLIDDIQFLADKERTQEEFFHTFNALYDAQKQIVITSDVPPRDIPLLEDRLRSRFEWGLIADIQPPDLETKIAILRKKAEAESIALPDDVALFIASNCTSNIRELEGALIRVVAFASITKADISLQLAKHTLADFVPATSPATTVETIQKEVSNYYNLRVNQLKSKTNSPQIAFPRQIAMYLCKQLTDCSLNEIGRRFGGKHHSTVIHAVRKIANKRTAEQEFDSIVQRFERALK